jgi:hypothetical protein
VKKPAVYCGWFFRLPGIRKKLAAGFGGISCFVHGSDLHIHGNQVKTTQTDKRVDNAGDKAHGTENARNEIPVKKADQSPVYGTDDDNGQRNIVKRFHFDTSFFQSMSGNCKTISTIIC